MNLTLSNRIKLLDPKKFFNERESQPCWFVSWVAGEKRKQCKWKLGVKYLGETEENTFSLHSFDLEDDKMWKEVRSMAFARKLLELFRTQGKLAVKGFLKDECIG